MNLNSIRNNFALKLPLFGQWLSKFITVSTAALILVYWPSMSQADTTENSRLLSALHDVYVDICKNGATDWLPTLTIDECYNQMAPQFTADERNKLNRLAKVWARNLPENQKKWMAELNISSWRVQSLGNFEGQISQQSQVALGPLAAVAYVSLPMVPLIIFKLYEEYEIFKAEYFKSLNNNSNCMNNFNISDDDPNSAALKIQAFKLCNGSSDAK